MWHSTDDRGVPFDTNVSAEAPHLEHVHEAVLEDGFRHRRDTLGDGVERRELRLHVCGKGWMRGGADIN